MKLLHTPAVAEANGRSRALHTYCRCSECRALDADHPHDGRQLTFLFQLARPRKKPRPHPQDKCA